MSGGTDFFPSSLWRQFFFFLLEECLRLDRREETERRDPLSSSSPFSASVGGEGEGGKWMAAFASLWKRLFYVSSRKNRVSYLSHIFERQYDETRKTFTLHYLPFLKEKIGKHGWGEGRKEEGKPPPGDAAGQEKKKPRPTYGFPQRGQA